MEDFLLEINLMNKWTNDWNEHAQLQIGCGWLVTTILLKSGGRDEIHTIFFDFFSFQQKLMNERIVKFNS